MLVDLNINSLEAKHQDRLSMSLAGYTHIIHEPTHLSGGLLDHFCVKKNSLSGKNVDSLVTNVYFSDHDAVRVTFSAG